MSKNDHAGAAGQKVVSNKAALDILAKCPKGGDTKPVGDSGEHSPGGGAATNDSDHCSVEKGKFSDPVFKKLAVLNGEINKMNKLEMKEKLAKLNLDTRFV